MNETINVLDNAANILLDVFNGLNDRYGINAQTSPLIKELEHRFKYDVIAHCREEEEGDDDVNKTQEMKLCFDVLLTFFEKNYDDITKLLSICEAEKASPAITDFLGKMVKHTDSVLTQIENIDKTEKGGNND